MGCFGCFEPQAVEDEPRAQTHDIRKPTNEQKPTSNSPATSSSAAFPSAHSDATQRKVGISPVPSVSSQESRDRAPLLLRGSPQIGTTPLTPTGSGSTGKAGNAAPILGRRPGTAGGCYEAPANPSHGSQDSLASAAGSTGQQSWHQEGAAQQQQLHIQQDQQRGLLAPPQRLPRDVGPYHPQRRMSRDGSQSPGQIVRASSASERETGAEPQRTGSRGRPASSSGVRAPTADDKTLQPHEPMPQPQAALGAITNQLGAPIAATTFSLRELERATSNFSPKNFVGEGGFGRVFRGKLESTGQIVAVKQLDLEGLQGNREFLVEVLMLSLLHHPNLVQLIGYCAEGDQRLLVYEFMANGALEDHLHDLPENKEGLDWNTRMKVAAGAAKGLEYLHDKASPPVIYRDFKSSNILLDETWHPKLSDFGLAKLGPVGDKTHVSTRVMGTYGYCAPEYAMTGQLTVKSDVYSFGVVLLELITGRRAIDSSRPQGEHNLVAWARPLFKDRRKFPAMADPLLQGRYPMRGLYQALAVAAMCLQEQAAQRPMIHDVVTALSYLAAQPFDPNAPQPRFAPGTPQHELGRDRRGSRSPQVRGMAGASPRQSPAHIASGLGPHAVRRGWDTGSGSPNLGPLGATSSLRGYRESPGRGGLASGRSTPVHPMARAYGENVNPNPVAAQVAHE